MPADDGRRVVVFGDLIDDIVVVPHGPIRPDTDTSSDIRRRPGGSAANAAAWLASVGMDVTFVGRCAAADVERHASALRQAGVDPALIADDTLPTGTIIVIVEGEQRTMLTERGANAMLSAEDVSDELLSGASLVHATGYSLIGHASAFADLVRRAHALGVQVSVNAGSVQAIDEVGRDAFLAAIEDVDVLFANAAEAAVLSGRRTTDAVAAALARRLRLVVVSDGPRGVVVAAAGAPPVEIPTTAAASIDTTGAGDALAAGFLAPHLRGAGPLEAARAGTRLAARAVAILGGRPPGPTEAGGGRP